MVWFHAEEPSYDDLLEGKYASPLTLTEFREFLFRRAGPRAAWKLDAVMAIRSWETQWEFVKLEQKTEWAESHQQIERSAHASGRHESTNQRSSARQTPSGRRDHGLHVDVEKQLPAVTSEAKLAKRRESGDALRQINTHGHAIGPETPLLPSPTKVRDYPMPLLSPMTPGPPSGSILRGQPLPAFLHSPPGSPQPTDLLVTAARQIAIHFLFSDSPMALPFTIPSHILLPVVAQIFEAPELSLHPCTFIALRDFIEDNLRHETRAGVSGFIRVIAEGNMVDVIGGGYDFGLLPSMASLRQRWRSRRAVSPMLAQPRPPQHVPVQTIVFQWLRYHLYALALFTIGLGAIALVLVIKSLQNRQRTFLLWLLPCFFVTAFGYLQLDKSFSPVLYAKRQRQHVRTDRDFWRRIIDVTLEPLEDQVLHGLQRQVFRRMLGFCLIGSLIVTSLFIPLWPLDVTDPSKFKLNFT